MGIKTVAVYSTADRKALHVRYADEAVCIGEAPSNQSYLRGEKIIEVAKRLGVDAIHPGYGFLSENAQFAKMVEEAGIIFVGPPVKAIEVMGSKLAAKESAKKFNVPMVPGTAGAITDITEAKKIAGEIGYPVLIKASAGGGGKGMRLVEHEKEFEEQMERAVSEAISAFGDGSVFIEKFVTAPKHIEVQILGDQHGNIVYLFERECSIQRRHQKVIEEAPSPILTPEVRKAIGEAAVNVARSCGYFNAGTVEFVMGQDLKFYFLEMNTRLQVEHPVTEQITGVDLVKEQIKIAQGEPLSFKQEDLKILGHALEIRVYAEDPTNNFLPDIGTLKTYVRPQGAGIRVDDGFEQGMEIPIYYDPMIAKLIATGKDREEAIARMKRAIDEYQITGIETTLGFCKFVLEHDSFISGRFDTNFVKNYFTPEKLAKPKNQTTAKVGAMVVDLLLSQKKNSQTTEQQSTTTKSNWRKRAKL